MVLDPESEEDRRMGEADEWRDEDEGWGRREVVMRGEYMDIYGRWN